MYANTVANQLSGSKMQGRGGSFIAGKVLGKLRCSDAWMAERKGLKGVERFESHKKFWETHVGTLGQGFRVVFFVVVAFFCGCIF